MRAGDAAPPFPVPDGWTAMHDPQRDVWRYEHPCGTHTLIDGSLSRVTGDVRTALDMAPLLLAQPEVAAVGGRITVEFTVTDHGRGDEIVGCVKDCSGRSTPIGVPLPPVGRAMTVKR